MAEAQQAYVAGALLASLGFNTVENTNLLSSLSQIHPSGNTAMRDSLLTGIAIILKLNSALAQVGMHQAWHFLHIVITDGNDTSSKAKLAQTIDGVRQVGQSIPRDRCRTVIIGIDLQKDVEAERQLTAIGEGGCEVYADVNSLDISSLFDQIRVSLGIERHYAVGMVANSNGGAAMLIGAQDQAVMHVSRQPYAVLFNLDISGSMRGARWQRVIQSVKEFLSKMPANDLVAGLCFNEDVMFANEVPPPKATQRTVAPATAYTAYTPASNYSSSSYTPNAKPKKSEIIMVESMQDAWAGTLFHTLGFSTVANNTILEALEEISPSGGTAMRDSLITGIVSTIALNNELAKMGQDEKWRFLHILLTDGEDTSSISTLQSTKKCIRQVNQKINKFRCRTIIIGIDLLSNLQAAAELIEIGQAGLENCEVYPDASSVDIDSLFDRIRVRLGIVREHAIGLISDGHGHTAAILSSQSRGVMQVSRQPYAVIFNLDISGSMAGSRWDRVKMSVREFLNNMPDDDIVAGICFNSKVQKLWQSPKPVQREMLQSEANEEAEQAADETAKKEPCCSCTIL